MRSLGRVVMCATMLRHLFVWSESGMEEFFVVICYATYFIERKEILDHQKFAASNKDER